MSKFLTEGESMNALIALMTPEDAGSYQNYGHLKVEAAFDDRVFVVYQPRGERFGAKTVAEQKDPTVISMIRVIGLTTDIRSGANVRLFDEASGTEMSVGYVPKKLFGYPIFVSLPTEMTLRLGSQIRENKVHRSFQFALLIKTRNRSNFYSTGNFYMETPNNFRKLFPAVSNEFSF